MSQPDLLSLQTALSRSAAHACSPRARALVDLALVGAVAVLGRTTLIKGRSNFAFSLAREAPVGSRKEAQPAARTLCVPTCLYAFNQPATFFFSFFFCFESQSRWRGESKHFSKSLLHFSAFRPPSPKSLLPLFFFRLSGKSLGRGGGGLFPRRRYWTVSQINCQCPGHFTGSSNYILGRLLARAHVAVGQPL